MSNEEIQAPESRADKELEYSNFIDTSFVNMFPDEETAEKWRKIENYRWPDDGNHCPYCGSTRIKKPMASSEAPEAYTCFSCQKRYYTQRDYEKALRNIKENLVRKQFGLLERKKFGLGLSKRQKREITVVLCIFVLSMLYLFDMSWFQFALLSGGTAAGMYLISSYL